MQLKLGLLDLVFMMVSWNKEISSLFLILRIKVTLSVGSSVVAYLKMLISGVTPFV